MTPPIASRAALTAFIVLAASWAAAQTDRQSTEMLMPKSVAGQDLFRQYCSSCHGQDAKGRTPPTRLRTHPPDLTQLSHRNGGAFPRDRVQEIITKGSSPDQAHWTWDMPVWGWIFRGLDPSETMVQIRISNLASYLESIQEP